MSDILPRALLVDKSPLALQPLLHIDARCDHCVINGHLVIVISDQMDDL